jgi:hypothetical protein
VLLADSCEAAVRSIDSPSREAVEETVEKIIKGKMDDGQLSAAPLTLRELYLIQQELLRTFQWAAARADHIPSCIRGAPREYIRDDQACWTLEICGASKSRVGRLLLQGKKGVIDITR